MSQECQLHVDSPSWTQAIDSCYLYSGKESKCGRCRKPIGAAQNDAGPRFDSSFSRSDLCPPKLDLLDPAFGKYLNLGVGAVSSGNWLGLASVN